MNGITWAMLALGVALLIVAKLSVVRMVQEINRRREPREWISLLWWPTYKDRQVMRTYHAVLPQGRLNIVYVGCTASGLIGLLLAVLMAAHNQT